MSQVPKNRTDLLPHYSRLIATLNKYMPDIGTEVVATVSVSFSVTQLYLTASDSSTKNSAIFNGRKMFRRSWQKSDSK